MLGPLVHDPEALLTFWFGTLSDGLADDDHRNRWFQPDQGFDDQCRNQWAPLLADAQTGKLSDWLTDPRGTLAYVVLCDQMPRNVHRGTEAAFAWDEFALDAARGAVARRDDLDLGWDERCFLYMPFEHSENPVDQHTAVGLFSALRDQSPSGIRHITGNYLRHAHQHRDIVLRFGRFPHRNAALGRTSSAEEKAFISAGNGFGQSA